MRIENVSIKEVLVTDVKEIKEIKLENGMIYTSLDKWRTPTSEEKQHLFPHHQFWIGEFRKQDLNLDFRFSVSDLGNGNGKWEFVVVNLGVANHDLSSVNLFVHHYDPRNKEKIKKSFHSKQGLSYRTREEKELEKIIATLQLDNKNSRFINTSQKIIIDEIRDEQIIKVSGRRTEKRVKQFCEYMGDKTKQCFYYYADITEIKSKRNTNNQSIIEYWELELSMNKRGFLYKLFKNAMNQRVVNYIIDDYAYDYHYEIIEEFMALDFIKYNRIKICRLSEFKSSGTSALKYIQ